MLDKMKQLMEMKRQADLLRSLNAAIGKSQGVAAQKMKSILPGF